MAAGGFVTRAFETMLKESGGKKFPDLQKAIQAYQDGSKVVTQAAPSSTDERSQAEGEGAKTGGEADEPQKVPSGEVEKSGTINISLANAGHTLGGAEVELVLKPLRLAFETKNLKIFDAALDCLHKLIAYDHLEGDPGLDGGKNSAPFTDILNMVCGCIDNSSPDSTVLQVLKVLLTAVASGKFKVHGEPLLGVIRVCYNIALNSKSPINQATSKAMLTQMISIVFRRMETDIVSSSSSVSQEEHVSGDSSSLKTEEITAADQSEKEMTLGDALTQAKDTTLASVEELHTLVGGADIKGLEAALDKAVHLEDGKKIKRGIELESMSIGQRDALLVFRTLCKMGMKEDSDEVTVKTRILSLELLQGMLEGVSHSFTKNFHFIDSLKAYLSYALLRASVSQSSVIFQYASGIFSVLLLRFRDSLKGEIGIFFPIIVLRSLDSSECPNDQKMGVLRMLEKVCKDPQMLVDVYVNYDCDLEAPNLFERMVTTLSKIAQGTQSADPNPAMASQTASVKGSSLQESSLVRLALNALQGAESSLISIQKLSSVLCSEPADRTTHQIPSLWHRLSSTDALGQILRNIGCFGSLVFLLHSFVDHFTSCEVGENEEAANNRTSYTLVNQAFAIAVRKVLEGYISGLDTLCASIELRRSSNVVDGSNHGPSSLGCLANVVHPKITLLEVFLHTRELRTQIEALANICDLYDISLSYCGSPWECLITEATIRFHGFYKGSDLLTYLYSQLKVADPAHSAMLKFLFLKACGPYCEFIRSWIYKAELNDPHKEFIVECVTESTSLSWNRPGISPLKRAREQEGGLVPCFLDVFLEPILRAGQQLQVITKLLELCNLSASGLRNYADLLPCWTHYSSSSLVYPSPITFNKLHIEVMIQKRDDYYRRMQEKLCDLSEKFELFLGQVPRETSLPISFGHGEKLGISSVNFTLDERLLVPSTVGMDLTRDQSGSESDDQKTEDGWFTEIDASCSSECSSTRDFSEASDVGRLDFQSTLAGPLPNYLSALRFSVASDGKCDENLVQHGESGYIDNNFVKKGEDTDPEESTEACEVDKFGGPLSIIKSWPLGGLPRNPFSADKDTENDRECPPSDSGNNMEQRDSMNNDESTLLFNNIPTGSCSRKQGERKHGLLENCSSSKLYLSKETKVNYPFEVLSMNPMLRCDFLRKNGNINRSQAKLLPWFDFSAVDDPSKTCLARIPVGFPVDFPLESHSSQTDRKSHRHANQECGIDRSDVEDPKVDLSSGLEGCAEENTPNASGGSRWEAMLLRSNNPETSALSDCRQSSSGTFELPLDFVIDKCLLQEILLQYNFVSKLAIKLLEEGFGLKEHLLALRRYHFMELADWADVFVVSLWHHKWVVTEADERIAEIQGFLESSIQRSSCERDTCKDRLFLYKRQSTMHLPPSTIGVRSFDFLGLGYRVDWPISIILTSDALKAYADVFSFLVQVKLAAYALTDVWCSLKNMRHTMHENKEGIAKQELRWLNILMKLRQQVNHFVSTLQQYIHSELSHVSWSKFLHSLKNKVKDMMDLESVHMVYLNEALRICFLSDETRAVSNVIENILQCALDFRSCLSRSTGRVPNASWTKTLGIDTCQVMMVKQKFERDMKDLYMCHRRSPKHGRFRLSRFWDCLNFNLYYSEILHDSNIFPLIP